VAGPPEVDRSRAAHVGESSAWDCPFPPEADEAGIDHAEVLLNLTVGADGRVTGATVLKDFGYAFGREARRCAVHQKGTPALDRLGNPTGASITVKVRFDR
jgi:protein TonB